MPSADPRAQMRYYQDYIISQKTAGKTKEKLKSY